MTHNNPLIAKWEELYNPKKEPPKEVEYELSKDFKEQLKKHRDTSTISVITPEGTVPLNSNSYISAKNASTSFKTYDIDSITDAFLQTSEKIKNGKAKVVSAVVERDIMRGMKITFEVLDT